MYEELRKRMQIQFPGVARTLDRMLSKRSRPEFRIQPVTSTGTSTFTSTPPYLPPVEVEILPMETEVEMEVFLQFGNILQGFNVFRTMTLDWSSSECPYFCNRVKFGIIR